MFFCLRPSHASKSGRIIASTAVLSMLLASCQGMTGQNNQSGSAAGSYVGGCVGGGLLGGLGGLALEGIKQKGSIERGTTTNKSFMKSMALGAGIGCAVGIGATAIGKILNEREQQRQDDVFQKAAQSAAEQAERDRLQVEERYRDMPPPSTEADRVARKQVKQQEIKTAQSKPSSSQSWSEGTTKGEAIYIGPATSPKTGEVIKTADGKDCFTIKEKVWKNGEQRNQDTTACRGADGHYTRVEVAST